MKLRAVAVNAVHYALREPLGTRHGALHTREGVRVTLELEGERGLLHGSGEALPLAALGTETAERCLAASRAQAAALLGQEFELGALLALLAEQLAQTPAARTAFDLAAHDLASRVQRVPLASLCVPARCGPQNGAHGAAAALPERVAVNAVCGAEPPERVRAAAQRTLAAGYGTLKLKLGSGDPECDVERVAQLRRALGPEPRLRVDANGAWSASRALAVLERLAEHDIELCEQPVAAHDLEGLARVQRGSPVPIAADESLALAEGRAACAEGALCAFAVLKPILLGGLAPAVSFAQRAARSGVRAIATTALDGPLGTAAALALAAAVGDPQLAHGLDAAAWIDAPFPAALRPRRGWLQVPRTPGLLGDG